MARLFGIILLMFLIGCASPPDSPSIPWSKYKVGNCVSLNGGIPIEIIKVSDITYVLTFSECVKDEDKCIGFFFYPIQYIDNNSVKKECK